MLTTDKSFGVAICQFNGLSSSVLIKQQLLCMIPEKIMFYLKPSCLVLSLTCWRHQQLPCRSIQLMRCLPFHVPKFVWNKPAFGVWRSLNLFVKCWSALVQQFLGRAPSLGCSSRCAAFPDVLHFQMCCMAECADWEIPRPLAKGLREQRAGSLVIKGKIRVSCQMVMKRLTIWGRSSGVFCRLSEINFIKSEWLCEGKKKNVFCISFPGSWKWEASFCWMDMLEVITLSSSGVILLVPAGDSRCEMTEESGIAACRHSSFS